MQFNYPLRAQISPEMGGVGGVTPPAGRSWVLAGDATTDMSLRRSRADLGIVLNWGLESPQNPQARMPALRGAGDFSVAAISMLNNAFKNSVKMRPTESAGKRRLGTVA